MNTRPQHERPTSARKHMQGSGADAGFSERMPAYTTNRLHDDVRDLHQPKTHENDARKTRVKEMCVKKKDMRAARQRSKEAACRPISLLLPDMMFAAAA